jgi:hypothetical protein
MCSDDPAAATAPASTTVAVSIAATPTIAAEPRVFTPACGDAIGDEVQFNDG